MSDQAGVCAALTMMLVAGPVSGFEIIKDTEDDPQADSHPTIVLPYAFSTELLETGIGLVYVKNGRWQPQDSLILTAYGTSNDSWGLAGSLRRGRFGNSRWFFSPMFYLQRNAQQRFYIESGFGVDETQGGSNDSGPEQFFQGPGWNAYGDIEFRYVAPIGMGRNEVVHRYDTDEGILTGGSTHGPWNPLKSGRTMAVVKPFFMWRTLVVTEDNIDQFPPFNPVELGQDVENRSNGITAYLEYDNRDFAVNPQQGSYQKLSISHDPGWLSSTNSWTSMEFDVRKYFSLGGTNRLRQQVIALQAWTAYTPTWKLTDIGNAVRIDNAPPENMGASLGGMYRLRGYPTGRFNDKAAIYYGAEYRVIPNWNPMKTWPLIRRFPWRWWQWAAFAEIGRVAPSWDLKTFHSDMKWSAGLSMRAMIASGVARLDLARSAEGTQVVIMVNHPF